MSGRPPNTKTIVVYLALGLLIVALASVLLGGSGGFRLLRTLIIYGGAFLLLMYVLRRARH